jgi:hypothetical protein
MFRSLFHDYLQGLSFVLSVFTTFQLPASSFVFFRYVAICHLQCNICIRNLIFFFTVFIYQDMKELKTYDR